MLDLPIVRITEKGAKRTRAGHPWVFEDDIESVSASGAGAMPSDGELVNVFTPKDRFAGTGYYNSASKIRVRIISTNANDRFDDEFYRRRVRYALDYRKTVMGDDMCSSRLIFGEADGFPGLTVDLFDSVLVAQTLCLGTEKIKDTVFEALCEFLPGYGIDVSAVYERCDVGVRLLEGMEEFKGYWRPEAFGIRDTETGTVTMSENGLLYEVDFVNGQKTGFFLDQKYNRKRTASLAKGRKVLDCFTHTGAFALNCAAAGASSVAAVDISETALGSAKRNFALNGLEGEFLKADVFALLTDMAAEKNRGYDLIILDPPAFTKSSSTVRDAYRGYKDINMRAMRCLPRGGYLATCSCSHFMTPDNFMRMLKDAADDAGVSLRLIEKRAQAPDHPVLLNVPETEYLKFCLIQVV